MIQVSIQRRAATQRASSKVRLRSLRLRSRRDRSGSDQLPGSYRKPCRADMITARAHSFRPTRWNAHAICFADTKHYRCSLAALSFARRSSSRRALSSRSCWRCRARCCSSPLIISQEQFGTNFVLGGHLMLQRSGFTSGIGVHLHGLFSQKQSHLGATSSEQLGWHVSTSKARKAPPVYKMVLGRSRFRQPPPQFLPSKQACEPLGI